jgi:hypothetical protein
MCCSPDHNTCVFVRCTAFVRPGTSPNRWPRPVVVDYDGAVRHTRVPCRQHSSTTQPPARYPRHRRCCHSPPTASKVRSCQLTAKSHSKITPIVHSLTSTLFTSRSTVARNNANSPSTCTSVTVDRVRAQNEPFQCDIVVVRSHYVVHPISTNHQHCQRSSSRMLGWQTICYNYLIRTACVTKCAAAILVSKRWLGAARQRQSMKPLCLVPCKIRT